MPEDLSPIRIEDQVLAEGFVQVPVIVVFDPDLSAGAKTMYGALLWYAWRFGGAPAQVTMAEELGGGRRTIQRHLAELEKAGYIETRILGLGRPNEYVIKSLQDRQFPGAPKMAHQVRHERRINRATNDASLQEQDLEPHTEQQQEPPARGKRPHDQGLPAARRTAVVVASSAQTEADGTDLTERLAALGVAKSTAAKLLQEHDPETVGRWVAYTEHRLRGGWVPNETPAAWLVSAIRSGDWIIPEWFHTPEEQAATAAADREAADAQVRRLEAAAERDREEAAAQRRAFEERLGIDEETRRVWQAARGLLHERGQGTLALASAYLLPLAGDEAAIATPVYFFCDRLAEREEAIRAALEEVTGREVGEIKITFVPADQKE